MKRFLIHITLFFLLFFIVDKAFCVFIDYAPQKEYDKRLQFVLDGQMNKDLIVLGSSRGANNIIAKQLEDSTGLSTYNLAYRGSNIEFHDFVCSTLLKFNKKPKKIILIIDSGQEFKNISLKFRYDRLLPLKKYEFINKTLINMGNKSVLSNYLCLAKIDRSDFKLSPVKVEPINLMSSHGSKIINSKYNIELIYNNSPEVYSVENESQTYIDAFRNIQNICDTNNIELVFAFTPNFNAFNVSFYKRFMKLVRSNNKVFVYDTLSPYYKKPEYFRDASHLMKEGAVKFTSELSTFINELD